MQVAVLCVAVSQWGVSTVAALYGGPMLVVNAWLVGYTWLQHTEVDIPHLPADNFSFIKGAFHTVDRPYGDLLWGAIDYLHHRIGSTHVAHHIDSTIPHYHARKATEAIAEHFPDLYMYEPTPIFQAMWRLATKCFEVEPRVNDAGERLYVFTDQT
jgi:omega-6 fatty acid desaturase (delta-12 desaturase)